MGVFFRGPSSFTGEDAAELHVHGSTAVTKKLYEELGNLGCQLASPGEFSQRAFLNGKMSLSEVDALGDLVDAETEEQRKQAVFLMEHQRTILENWRNRLVQSMAKLEAWIDFAEDEQIDASQSLSVVNKELDNLLSEMNKHKRRAKDAEIVRTGFKVVLAGRPNVGKSSLLNRLAGRKISIVSDIPGTTRDLINVPLDIGGYRVLMSDTAGLNKSSHDPIEQEGILLAKEALDNADLILYLTDELEVPIGLDPRKTLLLLSKYDINAGRIEDCPFTTIPVSCKSDAIFESFKDQLRATIESRFTDFSPPVVIRERHQQSMHQVINYIEKAKVLASFDVVLAAEALRKAAKHVGDISGQNIDNEQVLDELFSSFCIGK